MAIWQSSHWGKDSMWVHLGFTEPSLYPLQRVPTLLGYWSKEWRQTARYSADCLHSIIPSCGMTSFLWAWPLGPEVPISSEKHWRWTLLLHSLACIPFTSPNILHIHLHLYEQQLPPGVRDAEWQCQVWNSAEVSQGLYRSSSHTHTHTKK